MSFSSLFPHLARWRSSLALALLLLVLFSAPVLALDKVHVVQRGETLASIARRFDIGIPQLAAHNDIDNTEFLVVGQRILVPSVEATDETVYGVHVVAPLDSLPDIAAAYDTTVETLMAANGLGDDSQIWVDQNLLVPVTRLPPQLVHHKVGLGETLSSIARAYGLTWQSLAIYNGLKDASSIKFGQTLTIPNVDITVPLPSKPAPLAALDPPPAPSTQIYAVQLGDSLGAVAMKFDVPLDDLLKVNDLDLNSPVWVGQSLRLPLRSDGSEPESAAPFVAPDMAPAAPEPTIQPAPAAPEPTIQPAAVAAAEQGVKPPSSVLHVVRPGETLAQIADKYEVESSQIYEFNALSAQNPLEVGQQLQIPLDLAGDPSFLGRRWVEVDLSEQTLTAWDGDELFLHTSISSGLDIYPTPVGLFRIWHMNPSQTMSGPGYSLDNVKHNMYFFKGYALHGTYWHDNFGTPMSHGCVNMREVDAEALYHFASMDMEVWVHH